MERVGLLAAGTKAVSPARWRGRLREGQGGEKKKRGEKKVDLPVAQLLAPHSRYYLLRLESPVSQGRTAEEAKYVTGDRQVSDRAGRSVGISPLEGKFVFGSVLSTTTTHPTPPTPLFLRFKATFQLGSGQICRNKSACSRYLLRRCDRN